MPNILDDIIASVVENKIPAGRGTKLNLKHEPLEEPKAEKKKAVEETPKLYTDISHCWLYERRLLWLKDHRNRNNWKLFRECWRQGQVCETNPQKYRILHYVLFCWSGGSFEGNKLAKRQTNPNSHVVFWVTPLEAFPLIFLLPG